MLYQRVGSLWKVIGAIVRKRPPITNKMKNELMDEHFDAAYVVHYLLIGGRIGLESGAPCWSPATVVESRVHNHKASFQTLSIGPFPC